MTTDSFQLRIVTPAGVILEEEVASVVLPSSTGEIGILPEHAEYNGLLGVGVLSYSKPKSSESEKLVVTGGFCQFGNSVLTILADTVDLPDAAENTKLVQGRAALEKIVDAEDTQTEKWQHAKDQLARVDSIKGLIAEKAH